SPRSAGGRRRAAPSRPGREPRVEAHVGRLEREHDVLRGDARGQQIIDDAGARPVVLDPDLPVMHVEVEHGAMHPRRAVPAAVDELVVPLRVVTDGLDADVTHRGVHRAVPADDALDDVRVLAHLRHRSILTLSTSTTRRCTSYSSTTTFPSAELSTPSYALSGAARNRVRSGSWRARSTR